MLFSSEKMASCGKPLRDQMLTAKQLRRPSNMLLKDYLRDDLSSCSSSGFKSLPRRQCCATVRFDILEKDLHAARNLLLRPTISHRSSCSFKVASPTISALHRASRAVINAAKLLPFPSISAMASSSSSYKKSNSKNGLLCKSLSRKMLSRSFWRKAIEDEVSEPRRWRSFRELLEEKEEPSDQHTQSSSTMSVTSGISSSTSGSSSGNSNGNSWRSSEFTWEILRSSSDNSDVVGVVSSENTTMHKTATKTGEDSTDGCTLEKLMDWAREEKEQLSPVSVLNCPFGDDEEVNSPLDSTSCCRSEGGIVAGNKNKHTQKSRRFDDVASSLKPIDLEKRMAILSLEVLEDELTAVQRNEKSKGEEKAWLLVNELETSRTTCMINRAEKKLLLDLFNNMENNEDEEMKEGEISKAAKEWISGERQGVSNMGWEVCVREMDRCERWTNISDEGVGMELEFEVLKSLMNELVLELTS
ncbi:uncharacterized protein LOC129284458 [Prosopis cineraria]|uniref:uncharacterized protein LOC129284458 n=1 Tax=Prosopis cineraria TaxID=364024 RepID=UPI00240EC744|nr:uncharacterized protein LOC129284458 [Prosopis cineraria]